MGYYVELGGQIDKETVALDEAKLNNIIKKYFWIEFDDYGFEYTGNWSDEIIGFFDELSKIIKKGEIIVDYDGDESRDIRQFRITKEGIWHREAKEISFDKWKPYPY